MISALKLAAFDLAREGNGELLGGASESLFITLIIAAVFTGLGVWLSRHPMPVQVIGWILIAIGALVLLSLVF